MAFMGLLSFAQSDANYSMKIYFTGGQSVIYDVAEVDSVVYTTETGNRINGHEYVDLGLSVKWATMNVGASSVGDYGDYFQWGEIKPTDNYVSDSCRAFRVTMGDIAGYAEWDAATANWGGTWRMPTYDECKALVDSCTWEWTTLIGPTCVGYKVIGPNGNYIYLTAAGQRGGTSLSDVGSCGFYWSSSPNASNNSYSWRLQFLSSGVGTNGGIDRHFGYSVRPVSQ